MTPESRMNHNAPSLEAFYEKEFSEWLRTWKFDHEIMSVFKENPADTSFQVRFPVLALANLMDILIDRLPPYRTIMKTVRVDYMAPLLHDVDAAVYFTADESHMNYIVEKMHEHS